MDNVQKFILDYIETEYSLPEGTDIDALNYVKSGYVDSMGIIRFIVALEDEFGVEFSDEELADPGFQMIGTLVKMIEQKMEQKR